MSGFIQQCSALETWSIRRSGNKSASELAEEFPSFPGTKKDTTVQHIHYWLCVCTKYTYEIMIHELIAEITRIPQRPCEPKNFVFEEESLQEEDNGFIKVLMQGMLIYAEIEIKINISFGVIL